MCSRNDDPSTYTKLVDEITGVELVRGQSVKTFRGEDAILVDWYAKPAPSTGRVIIEMQSTLIEGKTVEVEYYPSVIGAEIV